MSHPESSGEEMDQPDSEMLTLVRTVQAADSERLRRLQVVQRAESEMLKRLHNSEVNAVYIQDKLVAIDSSETRFFDEWKRLRHRAIITEREVRFLSQILYARFAFYMDWFPRLGTGEVGEYKRCWSRWHQHICEGLNASSCLFAAETSKTIQFRRAEEFPQFNEYSENEFKIGDTACSFQDWRQGFTLALLSFGAATTDDQFVKETVREYPSDIDFIKRYTKEVSRGPRQMLSTLRRFAKDWDTFIVPLRFFTTATALDFVVDQYHRFEDPTRFRVVFLKGGSEKHRQGLKLTSARPPIVRAWSKNVILLNAPAAAFHGYNAALLQKVLSDRYKRRVSV